MTTLTLILRIIFVVSTSMALLSAAHQDYHCGLVRRRTFLRAATCQFAASVAVVTGAWFVGWRGFDWLELNGSGLKWLDLESSASARPGLDSSSLTSSTPSPLQAFTSIATPIVTQLFTQIVTALSVGVSICALGFLCHRLMEIAGKRHDSAAIHRAHTGVRSKISARVAASDSAQTQAASPTELSPQLPPQLPPQSGFGLADVWAAALSAQTLTLLWPVTDALLLWCLLWFATSVHALVSHQREEKEPQRKEGGARQLRLLPHLLWTWSVLIPTLLLIHPP